MPVKPKLKGRPVSYYIRPGITFSILRDEPDLRQKKGSIASQFSTHRDIRTVRGKSATVVDQGHDVRTVPVHKLRMWLKRKIRKVIAAQEESGASTFQ